MDPVSVYPADAVITIGLSYNPHNLLDSSVVDELLLCASLQGPLAQGIDHEYQCQPGTPGRYVYVYMETRSRDRLLDILEIQLYISM